MNNCNVCGFPITEYPEGKCCSEFCGSSSEETIATFLNMKPGDFGKWPCTDCGCIIGDEYTPKGCCYKCYDIRKAIKNAFVAIENSIRIKKQMTTLSTNTVLAFLENEIVDLKKKTPRELDDWINQKRD